MCLYHYGMSEFNCLTFMEVFMTVYEVFMIVYGVYEGSSIPICLG